MQAEHTAEKTWIHDRSINSNNEYYTQQIKHSAPRSPRCACPKCKMGETESNSNRL